MHLPYPIKRAAITAAAGTAASPALTIARKKIEHWADESTGYPRGNRPATRNIIRRERVFSPAILAKHCTIWFVSTLFAPYTGRLVHVAARLELRATGLRIENATTSPRLRTAVGTLANVLCSHELIRSIKLRRRRVMLKQLVVSGDKS